MAKAHPPGVVSFFPTEYGGCGYDRSRVAESRALKNSADYITRSRFIQELSTKNRIRITTSGLQISTDRQTANVTLRESVAVQVCEITDFEGIDPPSRSALRSRAIRFSKVAAALLLMELGTIEVPTRIRRFQFDRLIVAFARRIRVAEELLTLRTYVPGEGSLVNRKSIQFPLVLQHRFDPGKGLLKPIKIPVCKSKVNKRLSDDQPPFVGARISGIE